jgi:signal-transduction protein with cAMP-binding, CBS, and nucleotidyltransferase domain
MAVLKLRTFRFPEHTCIAQAQPPGVGRVHEESPALSVMTDLAQVKAATIDPAMPLTQAEQVMIHQGVRLLFVVRDFPCVDGLVTAADLVGEKPMRLVNQRNLRHDELCVADVMTTLPQLDALEYAALQEATVADVIAAFRQFGRSHLLVVQDPTPQAMACIRGVISRAQLERQLGRAIEAAEIADTFAQLERALA